MIGTICFVLCCLKSLLCSLVWAFSLTMLQKCRISAFLRLRFCCFEFLRCRHSVSASFFIFLEPMQPFLAVLIGLDLILSVFSSANRLICVPPLTFRSFLSIFGAILGPSRGISLYIPPSFRFIPRLSSSRPILLTIFVHLPSLYLSSQFKSFS